MINPKRAGRSPGAESRMAVSQNDSRTKNTAAKTWTGVASWKEKAARVLDARGAMTLPGLRKWS